jgi:hypothetical protein
LPLLTSKVVGCALGNCAFAPAADPVYSTSAGSTRDLMHQRRSGPPPHRHPEMARANLRFATVGPFYRHQAAQNFSPRSSLGGNARIPHQAVKPWPRFRTYGGAFFRMIKMPALRRNIRPTRSVADGTGGGLTLTIETAPLRRGFFMGQGNRCSSHLVSSIVRSPPPPPRDAGRIDIYTMPRRPGWRIKYALPTPMRLNPPRPPAPPPLGRGLKLRRT